MTDHIRFWKLVKLGGSFDIDTTPADRLDWLLRIDGAFQAWRKENPNG